MSSSNDSKRDEIRSYAIGYGLALLLTSAAFALVRWSGLAPSVIFACVLGLALAQVVVHFRCFLQITLDNPSRDSLQLILFSAVIVILMVSGTLVLLFNLRARMM